MKLKPEYDRILKMIVRFYEYNLVITQSCDRGVKT